MLPHLAAAQQPAAADTVGPVARGALRCGGQAVSRIDVRTEPPYPNSFFRRWPGLRFITEMHVTTDETVVRRFLALRPGDRCTELRRTESERILLAQPFLADATVTAFADTAGTVRLEVVTVDELTLIVGGSVIGESPYVRAVRLGEGNLFGSATSVSGGWRDGLFYRDEFSFRFRDHQLAGRPYELETFAARTSLGSAWDLEVRHPFYTDLQRIAWRANIGRREDYYEFLRPAEGEPAVRTEREWADIGGIIRIGRPGRLSLFGASVSREEGEHGGAPVLVTDTGVFADTSTALVGRYGTYRSSRLNALWGVRNLTFRRVRGFDALTGPQDVLVGFSLGTMFGRSLTVLGSAADDIFLAADLYAGYGGPRAFGAIQSQTEGRQNYDTNRWEGVLTSGRAAFYVKPHPRHTVVTSAEWAAGWRHRTPFQLSIGDSEGGVRGYRDTRDAGAQRAVLRVEERWWLGRPRGVGDLGIGVFSDAGRIWAGQSGDVPFATDSTNVKWSAGISLLAGIPPRSRQLWRLDIAFPLTHDEHAGWEIRLTGRDLTRMFFREPNDVSRSRERTVPVSVFRWP